MAQQLQFIVRDQSGNILPIAPNTRFTWKNTAIAGDLVNGNTPDIVMYQAKSTFTSPPPRVDQVDAQIDGVTTVSPAPNSKRSGRVRRASWSIRSGARRSARTRL